MNEAPTPKLPHWPFLILNVFLAGLALWLLNKILPPRDRWEVILGLGCLATGALAAWIGCIPFLRNFTAEIRVSENQQLNTAVERIQQLETIGQQISTATARWQTVQETAASIVQTSNQITERMGAESRSFQEFMTNAQSTENAHLRLEIEKLKRGEREWLQSVGTVFDHVFALHGAALLSGQSTLIDQLSQFQNACRDSVRRVGLNPFAPKIGDPFDSKSQQMVQGEESSSSGTKVINVVACGFTFQGQMIRHALVSCSAPASVESKNVSSPQPDRVPEPTVEDESIPQIEIAADAIADNETKAVASVSEISSSQSSLPF